VIRPTNAIPLVVLSGVVLVRHPRRFAPYALWMLPVAIPAAAFTVAVHHTVLPAYYAPGKIGHGTTFLPALVGTLVSPSRGLFVFSPVLVLSVYGAWLKLRRDRDLLDAALATIVLAHWIALSSFPIWWGGHSFGYRLFSDMVPYLVYFLIPVFAEVGGMPRRPRAVWTAAVAVLVAISFGINYRGASTRVVYRWNSEPVNVDSAPSRLWDWSDPQFLRELWGAPPPRRR
jgi:hypothetical protein